MEHSERSSMSGEVRRQVEEEQRAEHIRDLAADIEGPDTPRCELEGGLHVIDESLECVFCGLAESEIPDDEEIVGATGESQ